MRSDEETLKIGVVGLGGLGTKHATTIAESDHALAGGVDPDTDSRESFEQGYDTPAFADLDALLDRDVDGIAIATPNKYHEPYAVEALDENIGVFCEKPLAHDLDSAERIADAARRSDAPFMIGFNNRFAPQVAAVREAIDAGRLGDVVHVEANWVRRRGIPGRGGWFTRKDLAGGGALIDIGVHVLDLALYLLDHPTVDEVSGITRQQFGHREDYAYEEMYGPDHGPDGFDVEDSAISFVRCEDGRTISLEAAWATNRPDNDEVIVRGTDAGARFTLSDSTVTFFEADAGADEPLPTTTVDTHGRDPYDAEFECFLDAVRAETQPEQNTIDDALVVQRIIDAVYESDRCGGAVTLD